MMTLSMMDFDGKDSVMQRVQRNGTMFNKLSQYMQMSLMLANESHPEMVEGLTQDIMGTLGIQMPAGGASGNIRSTDHMESGSKSEPANVQTAKAQSAEASQPDGGRVTGKARD